MPGRGGAEYCLPAAVRAKPEAIRLAHELELRDFRIANGLSAAPSAETIAEAWERYRAVIQEKQRSFTTTAGRWKKWILPALGDVPVQQLRPVQVEDLLSEMAKAGTSQMLRRHVCTTLSAFYEYLRRKERSVLENPLRSVDVPPVPKAKKVALTPEQVLAIARAATFRGMRDYILFLYCTEARAGEGRNARKTDVDFSESAIHLDRTKVGKEGVAVLPAPAVALLLKIFREVPGEYLFLNATGTGPLEKRAADRAFKTAVARAGLVERWEAVCRRKGCGLVDSRKPAEGETCGRCGFTLMARAVPKRGISLKTLRTSAVTLVATRGGEAGLYAAKEQAGHGSDRTTQDHYVAKVSEVVRHAVEQAYSGLPIVDVEAEEPTQH